MLRFLPLVLVAVLTAAGAPKQAAADGATPLPAPRFTDDTPEYCRALARRLADLPAARAEPSRSLGEEGRRLCGEGHVRTGVTKLRRAMRAATGPTAPDAGEWVGTQ